VDTVGSTRREELLNCPYFRVMRIVSSDTFEIGVANAPAVLICVKGGGDIEYGSSHFGMKIGSVFLLPAAAGKCGFRPNDHTELLEITIPDT
jgi:mannose-6-phosphate isomerase class I